MTRRTTARDLKIKAMVLKRIPVKTIASRFKLHPNTVRGILTNLVAAGELVRIPNTNPALYSDPHAGATEQIVEDGGYVQCDDMPYMDCLPPTGHLPLGFVNRHIRGFISMSIRKKGDFSNVSYKGLFCGYWDPPKSGGRGQTL